MHQVFINDSSWSYDEIIAGKGVEQSGIKLIHDWLMGNTEFLFHSSGSTGNPRLISFTRKQVLSSIYRTIQSLQLTQHDHFLCCLSPSSIAGAMMILRAAALGCAITIIKPSSDPWSLISDQHDFTFASFVPMQLHASVLNEIALRKLDRFRILLIGGAAISNQLNVQLKQAKSECYETYGMTETLSHVALRKIKSEENFRLLPGIIAQTTENGCMKIKADVTNEQWIITNDLVQFDDDKSFTYLGRADGIINSGGVKVIPELVEKELSELIVDIPFFIAAFPDEKLGECVTLFFESQPECTFEAIKTFLANRLKPFEIPKKYFVCGAFEYTVTGKMDKRKTVAKMNST